MEKAWVGPVVFCESGGRWAMHWRRAWRSYAPRAGLDPSQPRIEETRSAEECLELIASTDDGFLAVELNADNIEVAFELINEVNQRHPGWVVAVLAARDMVRCRWYTLELGGWLFIDSARELSSLFKTVRVHLLRPMQRPAGTASRIWSSLPWPTAAASPKSISNAPDTKRIS